MSHPLCTLYGDGGDLDLICVSMHPLCRLNASASRAVICQKQSRPSCVSACHLRPALLAAHAPAPKLMMGAIWYPPLAFFCLAPLPLSHVPCCTATSSARDLAWPPESSAVALPWPRHWPAPNARACNTLLAAGHSQFRSSRLKMPHTSFPPGCIKHSSQTAHC